MWWKKVYHTLKKQGYAFENSRFENKGKTETLKNGITEIPNMEQTIIDLKKHIKKMVRIHQIDYILPVEVKGAMIYYGLTYLDTGKLIRKTIHEFQIEMSDIAGKNILIIDDCIKSGDTIISIIEKLLNKKVEKIVVFSLATRKETLEKINKKFAEEIVIIDSWNIVSEHLFTISWRNIAWQIIEYHGIPLLHTPFTIGIVRNEKELVKLFKDLVPSKNIPVSLLTPAVVSNSRVLKGSFNYTENSSNDWKNINSMIFSNVLIRFCLLQTDNFPTIIILYPDFQFNDFFIDEDECSHNQSFKCCFKKYSQKKRVCPDCTYYNVSRELNNQIYNKTKKTVKVVIHNDKTFLERNYPQMIEHGNTVC